VIKRAADIAAELAVSVVFPETGWTPGSGPFRIAGDTGNLDTRFWKRFGGAVMRSILGTAGETAAAKPGTAPR